MIDLEHLMLYDGKPWKFSDFNEPLVIDLQGLEYKQGGVPVIVKGKPDGHADITIAPIDKRDEIGLAIYADVHVEDGKLPENYTVGLDINIDDKYYMHPGTNLEINQDKWIVSSKGVWIAEPVTINAVYISEETTTTWLIDGWKNTITQPEQKTEVTNMVITDTQYNSFQWDKPIKNEQKAQNAINRCVAENAMPSTTTPPFPPLPPVSIEQCAFCGQWPEAFIENHLLWFGCKKHFHIPRLGKESAKQLIIKWHKHQTDTYPYTPIQNRKKEMEHTQTENYDLSQPICENPQLALEALKQIIQANKDGNNEVAICMTVKRCQTCGAWPTCRLDSDGQHVTIAIECPQNTDHPRIIAPGNDTVKDIIRTWNHQNSNPFMDPKPEETEHKEKEMNYEQGRINNYDWNEPVSKHLEIAYEALQQCIVNNFSPFPTCNPKMTIDKHRKTDRQPVAFINKDNESIGLGLAGGDGYWTDGSMSLKDLVNMWNKAQDAEEKHDDAITSEMIEKYDWNEPIKNNRELAADVLEACIERNFPEKSQFDGAFMYGIPAKMEILRHRNSGEIPKVMHVENGSNIGIGVEELCYVWANPSDTLTTLVNKWNKLQGKAANETTEEPPKETSLDVMGRNAIELNQKAKTIEALEAEADRGLPNPEAVQRLKGANVRPEGDSVNHPSHYTSHPSGIECIQVTEHYDFCIGNAIKYLWRAGLKTEEGMSDKEKEIEDLKKAVWYIQREIQRLEKETED